MIISKDADNLKSLLEIIKDIEYFDAGFIKNNSDYLLSKYFIDSIDMDMFKEYESHSIDNFDLFMKEYNDKRL